VKLVDFGSASFYSNASTNSPNSQSHSHPDQGTLFSRFLGTLQYAPPEILKGHPYCGPSAEIWALGCCLYIMLTGSVPFDSPEKACNSEFRRPRVSGGCLDLLSWMLCKDPRGRPGVEDVMEHGWMQ